MDGGVCTPGQGPRGVEEGSRGAVDQSEAAVASLRQWERVGRKLLNGS